MVAAPDTVTIVLFADAGNVPRTKARIVATRETVDELILASITGDIFSWINLLINHG